MADNEIAVIQIEGSKFHEVLVMILQWVSLRTRPNNAHKYSRCVICGQSWWEDKEQHAFTCWVPLLKKCIDNPRGFKKETAKWQRGHNEHKPQDHWQAE